MLRILWKVCIIGLCKTGLVLAGGVYCSTWKGAGCESGSSIGLQPQSARISPGLIFRLCSGFTPTIQGQSAAVQQLLLDVAKLSQFKQILADLQTSYEVLKKGYSSIKNIASGNFSLHEAFLDGLLLVNPSIARYSRVADIISDELNLVRQYKQAFKYFKSCGRFKAAELNYMGKVYNNLVNKSLDNLDALTTVLTGGKLRMSDDERLEAINRIYRDTHKMLGYLMDFNKRLSSLASQRMQITKTLHSYKLLQGLK